MGSDPGGAVAELDKQGNLDGLDQMAGDPTGTRTFARYRWQAKQAVRHWLTCLKPRDAPKAVVCERLEDITVVHCDRLRFAQLKTRDRGSWSGKSTCDPGHGMDSLVRTYKAARDIDIHHRATFELWLEGPMSGLKETGDFFERPPSASSALRSKIISLGLPKSQLDDFLGRLVVQVHQPSRSHIDAVILREMSALWPAISINDLEDVYDRLLRAAESAQAGEHPLGEIRRFEAQCLDASEIPSPLDGIAAHVLSKDMIRTMTPPLAGASDQELLDRMARGELSSMLELKLIRAGASAATIQQAKELRAQAEIVRQLALASRSNIDSQFEDLSKKVLMVARAMASRANLNGVANPVAASRPADYVSAELLSNPAILGQLDKHGLFDGDGLDVFGYLCQLSDECHFPWRVA